MDACAKCGLTPTPRNGPGIRWGSDAGVSNPRPQDAWSSIGMGVHRVHYERGTAPFVLVRHAQQAPTLADRSSGLFGVPLFVGQTMELDCERQYEVRAPADFLAAATEPDTLKSASAVGISRPCSLLLDVEPDRRVPSTIAFDWDYAIATGTESATAIVWLPVRGIEIGQVVVQSASLGGSLSATLTIQTDVEGTFASVAAATLIPFTAASDSRAVVFGESDRLPNDVMGLTPTKIGGLIDRLGILLTKTGTGTLTLRFSVLARLHEVA